MPKGRIGRDGQTKRLPSKALKAAGLAVGAALVVCLVIGAALMRQQPEAVVSSGVDNQPPTIVVAAAPSQQAPSEPLLSDDPMVVAAAVVDLRDDWFYADNDELMVSIDAVFGGAATDGALFLLSGLSAQRAGVLAATEPNKTFYRSEALSAQILGEADDGAVLVEVWDMEVISQRNLVEPQVQWGRQRLMLQRNSDRWVVTGWTALVGPAPALSQSQRPVDALAFEADLGDHRRLEDSMGIDTIGEIEQ